MKWKFPSLLLLVMILMNFVPIQQVYADTNLHMNEFVRSQTREAYQQNPIFYITVNGHELSIKCTQNHGSHGTLYADGMYIDNNVLWKYFSDGFNVYYTKADGIYRANIETCNKEFLVSDEYGYIYGIYKNKYLYYGTMKYSDITNSTVDMIIYDLENKTEVTYIVDVGNFALTDNKIYTTPCDGDAWSAVPITEMNLDGSELKQITDDAASNCMEVIDNRLYYPALDMSEGYRYIKSQIRKYDSRTKTTKILTEYNYGLVHDINSEYAIFENFDGVEYRVDYKKEIKVVLNGKEIEFDQPPVIVNGRVLVPLRAIFEAMGANVAWENTTKTATVVKDSTTIKATIGSSILYKNGEQIPLDVPPQLINDYTMVPVRAIAEAFGSEVTWDNDTYTVTIKSIGNSLDSATFLSIASDVGIQQNGNSEQRTMCSAYCVAYIRSYYDNTAQNPYNYWGAGGTQWGNGGGANTKKASEAELFLTVKTEIDNGRPCIIHVKGTGKSFPTHYVVVFGYSESCSSISNLITIDPWDGKVYSGSALEKKFALYSDNQIITFTS